MPILIFILIRFIFKVEIQLITSICIYGYSFTILLPLLFLCIIPIEIAKYVTLGYGLIHSTMFLVYNMYQAIDEKAEKSKYFILGLIIGFQVFLYFLLKFYFFSAIPVPSKI